VHVPQTALGTHHRASSSNMRSRSQHDRNEASRQQGTSPSKPVEREQLEAENNDEPLLKKPCLEEHERSDNTPTEARPSHLLNLPLELLAEILILTESPKHILAVARSCKVLCATLIEPSSAYMWRTARNICEPEPLPEPYSIFTESSYAAFVFDGGRCEVSEFVLGNIVAA
jgi:hypothetical protein